VAQFEPWRSLYRFGEYPGLILGIGGLVAAIAGRVVSQWRAAIAPGLFLAISLALGPGLVINGVFKPTVNRPRPSAIAEFGGDETFVPILGYNSQAWGRSFPCGHASMGFFLGVPAFLIWRRRPGLALGVALAGVVSGSLIGMGRIVEGRHFLSDVIWAGAMVYFAALATEEIFRGRQRKAAVAAERETDAAILALPSRAATEAAAPPSRERRKAA
jgi:membrane-associated PAP2 superfamily phosphatase